MVLGRGADQRGAADVDVLDAFVVRRAARDGRLERVQVDHDQVDRRDVVRGHLRAMLRQVAAAEDAAVDLRDQGFDAAVEDFREAGVLGDFLHGDRGFAQRAGRAAGGQDFHPVRRQCLGEREQPGLVGDRDQGAGDWDDVSHGGVPRLRDRARRLEHFVGRSAEAKREQVRVVRCAPSVTRVAIAPRPLRA